MQQRAGARARGGPERRPVARGPRRCPIHGQGRAQAPAAGGGAARFDPSLVGAFANACPGCTDAECCAARRDDAGQTRRPRGRAGGSTATTAPGGQPRQRRRGTAKKPRYDKSLKVTTDAGAARATPRIPTNTEHEWNRCINGLTEACLRGDGASQLLTPNFEYAVPVEKLAKQLTNAMHSIRDDHVKEAKAILDAALESVGGAAEVFERKVCGEEVDQATAEKTYCGLRHGS